MGSASPQSGIRKDFEHGSPRPDENAPLAGGVATRRAPDLGRHGAQLLAAADTAHALAEQGFDRSPETRACFW